MISHSSEPACSSAVVAISSPAASARIADQMNFPATR
jgi:hypothetical protein